MNKSYQVRFGSRVVDVNFRQGLSIAEMKIVDDKIALDVGGCVGGLRELDGEEKCERCNRRG